MKKLLFLIAVVSAVLIWNEIEEQRLRGYQHDGVDGDLAIIDAEGEILVDPDVNGYRVVDDYIIGMRVESKYPEYLWEVSPKFGYFVLNMETKKLEEGMCWHELVANLAEKAVSINSLDRFIIDYL